MATLVFTTLRFQKVFTTFNLVSLLSGNSSPWFHCAPGLCLTLYVLAIKLYWQANKKHLPTQSNKHNRKQKPKERGQSPTQTTTKQPPRHQEKNPRCLHKIKAIKRLLSPHTIQEGGPTPFVEGGLEGGA